MDTVHLEFEIQEPEGHREEKQAEQESQTMEDFYLHKASTSDIASAIL